MARRSRFPVLALQVVIAVLALVPIGAGLAGVLSGLGFLGDGAAPMAADSHVRYLSGLLLAVGLLFWSTIPRIEHQARRVRLLTFIVFVGGLGRLFGVLTVGLPDPAMLFGLGMELVVTPLICLWQSSIAVHRWG